MPSTRRRFFGWRMALGAAGFLVLGSLTGCQVDVGGQTLPSPYYLGDDIQYFPAGPEFKLPNEAAALKAEADEQKRLDNRQSRFPTQAPAAVAQGPGPN